MNDGAADQGDGREQPLEVEQRGALRVLRFTRARTRHAIDDATADALLAALADAADCPQSCCLVLTSSHPDVFLSGGDLREIARLLDDPAGADRIGERGVALAAIERHPLPVIAAVHGASYGGGCELLLMCDVVAMEQRASLRFVHGRMGLTPAWGGTTRLVERVGVGAAADLLLTAAPVDAARALQLGLAQHLVANGGALPRALELGAAMAQLGRPALVALKRSLREVKLARRGAALDAGRAVFREAFAGERVREAVAAFLSRSGSGKPEA